MRTARNVAIILLAALVVDLVPGGGDAAEALLAGIMMAFLAAISWFVYRLYRQQQMTLMTLSDARRALLFGAVGAIALLFVAFEQFETWSGGIVVWIGLMAAAVGAIFLVWREATSY